MNPPGRFLIIGGDGLIGRALARRLEAGGAEVFATTRRFAGKTPATNYLNFAEDISGWRPPKGYAAAVICAAVTRQEHCRQEPVATRQINVARTMLVAQKLAAAGTFPIFLSTNLVFDGAQPLAQAESPTNPRTEYGRQKALAEQCLFQLSEKTAAVRLTKVFHPGMPLLQQWVAALRQGQTISPLTDLVCSPIPLSFVVEALEKIARQPAPGIFQISGEQDVSYAAIAQRLAQRMKVEAKLVRPATSLELGLKLEHLPAHTTLDAGRLAAEYGLPPPPVWATVDAVLQELLAL